MVNTVKICQNVNIFHGKNNFKPREWHQKVIILSNEYQKRVEHPQNDLRIQYGHYRKLGRTILK